MKAVEPGLDDHQAVMSPIAGPTAKQHEDADERLNLVPRPKSANRQDQPRGDHRREAERSTRARCPLPRTADQALADDDDAEAETCCPTPVRFGGGQERGADERPDGRRRAARRATGSRRRAAQRTPPQPAAVIALPLAAQAATAVVQRSGSAQSVIVTRCPRATAPRWPRISCSLSNGGSLNSANTSPRTSTTTRSAESADRQTRRSRRTAGSRPVEARVYSSECLEQQFLRGDVDSPCRRDWRRSAPARSRARARPSPSAGCRPKAHPPAGRARGR